MTDLDHTDILPDSEVRYTREPDYKQGIAFRNGWYGKEFPGYLSNAPAYRYLYELGKIARKAEDSGFCPNPLMRIEFRPIKQGRPKSLMQGAE